MVIFLHLHLVSYKLFIYQILERRSFAKVAQIARKVHGSRTFDQLSKHPIRKEIIFPLRVMNINPTKIDFIGSYPDFQLSVQ